MIVLRLGPELMVQIMEGGRSADYTARNEWNQMDRDGLNGLGNVRGSRWYGSIKPSDACAVLWGISRADGRVIEERTTKEGDERMEKGGERTDGGRCLPLAFWGKEEGRAGGCQSRAETLGLKRREGGVRARTRRIS